MNHFLIGLWKVHFIPSEDTQLSHWTRRSSKAIPKASFAQKKVMVTVQWSAVQLMHYSFLHPSKRLYLRSIFNKLMRCTENSKTCSSIDQQKEPTLLHENSQLHMPQSMLPKLKELGTKFCLICHIHLKSWKLITTSSSISTIFEGKIISQTAGGKN